MTTVELDLAKGDWIVHNMHGLGQVVGLDSKEISGDKKIFYEVKTKKLTYWLAVSESNSNRIRHVASTRTIKRALKVISSEPQPLSENFRKRLNDIRESIEDGSLKSKALLIRDLHARNVKRDIHVNEKRILDTLKQQFVNEYAKVFGVKPEEASTELREALKKSSANINL